MEVVWDLFQRNPPGKPSMRGGKVRTDRGKTTETSLSGRDVDRGKGRPICCYAIDVNLFSSRETPELCKIAEVDVSYPQASEVLGPR